MSNKQNHTYLMVVEKSKKKEFRSYCKDENQTIISWLGDPFE